MCVVDKVTAMSRTLASNPWKIESLLPPREMVRPSSDPCVNVHSLCRKFSFSPLPQPSYLLPWRMLPTEIAPNEISWTCPFDPPLYPPSCLSLCNKPVSLFNCVLLKYWAPKVLEFFCQVSHSTWSLLFCVFMSLSVCLSAFSSFSLCPSQVQTPWSYAWCES